MTETGGQTCSMLIAHSEKDWEEFYEDVDRCMDKADEDDIIVVGGDWRNLARSSRLPIRAADSVISMVVYLHWYIGIGTNLQFLKFN